MLFVLGRRADRWGHILGVLSVVASFVIGLLIFLQTLGLEPAARTREQSLYDWISVAALQVDFGLRLDPLSLTFVLLITGVGGLIHIYAVGYMAPEHGADPHSETGDPSARRRFFAQFNLFITAMLLLVLGNNFVLLYLGWEGVGLASYLLIGFYQGRPSAATAAKKAFLMNRVGDVGLALAIFILWTQLGTLQYTEVFANVGRIDPNALVAITLLLLLGACGKSGQFPLQAWLPDAMEGPTPVSALIHAATMVTAGVYLIARMNPLYDLTETGQVAVAIIGTITLLIGAIIGCAYDDIKKVLAYSTVSQIGYMFLAVGLGPYGYALGIAHLLAHGFFKAGLFLGAGSVMHAMNDNVDMRHYGGLWRVMPITFVTFGLGYLALIGFPPLSGFFTKDAIIEAAFAAPGLAGLDVRPARHARRRAHRVLHDPADVHDVLRREALEEPPSADGHAYHPHESPAVMTVPMIVLAIGSVGAGFFLIAGPPARQLAHPVARRAARARGPAARGGHLHARAGVLGDRCARRVAGGRAAAHAGGAPAARVLARAGRAARPVRQRDQRGAHRDARHLAVALPGLLRQPRRRRGGQRHGRAPGRRLGPVAPAADRLRPLVRALDARRRGAGRRGAAGGEVRVNGGDVLAPGADRCCPLVGAVGCSYPLRRNPRHREAGRDGAWRWPSSCWRSSCGSPTRCPPRASGTRFQLESSIDWIPAFGARFAFGHRRHRAGDASR